MSTEPSGQPPSLPSLSPCRNCGHPIETVAGARGQTDCPVCGTPVFPSQPPVDPRQLPGQPGAGSSSPSLVIPLISMLGCVAVCTAAVFLPRGGVIVEVTPERIGYVIGLCMMAGILGALLGSLLSLVLKIFGTPFFKTIFRTCSGTVLMSAFVVVLAARKGSPHDFPETAREHDKRMVEGMRDDVNELVANYQDKDGNYKTPDIQFDTSAPANNDGDRIRLLMRDLFNDSVAMQQEYEKALDKEGISILLDAARLDKDKDLKESRAILARLDHTAATYREKTLKIFEELPAKLETISKSFDSPARARGFTSGVENGMKGAKIHAVRMWDMEEAVLGHMAGIIGLLESRAGHWVIEEGQIVFDNDEDLEAFNSLLGKITEVGEEQMKLQTERLEEAQRKMEKLK